MFKKRSGGPKKVRSIRRVREDDNDSDVDHDRLTSEQIQKTKKKRKLLTAVQYKRGVDANQLLQSDERTLRNEDLNGGASSNVNTAVETSKDGVLERKHQQAMEDYIAQQIGVTKNEPSLDSKKETEKKRKAMTEEELYLEIAASVQQLAGKEETDDSADAGAAGDSGSGGAVLIAGTGIAEVILPVQERLKVAQETEKASLLSSSKLSSRGPRTSSTPSAVPNRFALPSRRPHPAEASAMIRNESSTTAEEAEREEANPLDDGRMGFDALKRRKEGTVGTAPRAPSQRDRSSDQRVFRNFVARQRDMKR